MKKKLDIAVLIVMEIISLLCYLTLRDLILFQLSEFVIPPTFRLITMLVFGLVLITVPYLIIRGLFGQWEMAPVFYVMSIFGAIVALFIWLIDVIQYYTIESGYWWPHAVFVILSLLLLQKTESRTFGVTLILSYLLVLCGIMPYVFVVLFTGILWFIHTYPETVIHEE